MDKALREKVGAFLRHTGIFKTAKINPAMMKRMTAMAGKAKGPALGAAAGAGGVLGLSALGERDM